MRAICAWSTTFSRPQRAPSLSFSLSLCTGPLIQCPERLAKLSDDQLFNTFYLPVLQKIVNESAEVRNELTARFGQHWSFARFRASALRATVRAPTNALSARALTRVAQNPGIH